MPGVAVDGDGARRGVDDAEEGGDEVVGRAGAVLELEVEVLKAVGGEGRGVVARLVEANDGADAHVAEDVDVVGGAELSHTVGFISKFSATKAHWSFESDKFSWYNLLKITIRRIVEVSIVNDVNLAPHITAQRSPNPT